MSDRVGVFSVATNLYFEYWADMVRSADAKLLPGTKKTFYVFTDQPRSALQLGGELSESQVVAFEIPSYGWPDATLKRYDLVCQHASEMVEDILLYIDADMIVMRDIYDLRESSWKEGLAMVRHPGYRRPPFPSRVGFYLRQPRVFVADLKVLASVGALGAWEERHESRAYVRRHHRKSYVYGAIWMGRREQLVAMCTELARDVEYDLRNGVVAVWHDESHLNRYFADNGPGLLDSDFAHVQGLPNLRGLEPLIAAVDKGTVRTR